MSAQNIAQETHNTSEKVDTQMSTSKENNFLSLEKLERLTPEEIKKLEEKAEAGDAYALTNLGAYFLQKEPFSSKAFEHFIKAAAKGVAKAQFLLGVCHEWARGTKHDYEEAFNCYLTSVNNGYKKGNYLLGYCYEKGLGTDIDLKLAMEAYENAIKENAHGEAAKKQLDNLISNTRLKALQSALIQAEAETEKLKQNIRIVPDATDKQQPLILSEKMPIRSLQAHQASAMVTMPSFYPEPFYRDPSPIVTMATVVPTQHEMQKKTIGKKRKTF